MSTFRQHLKKKDSISSGCSTEDVYTTLFGFFMISESFLRDVYECFSKINRQVNIKIKIN